MTVDVRRKAAAGEHGTALITALIMLMVLGVFLLGFQSINRNELAFAGYSRNSTLAFSLAEAGEQEGIKRLSLFGAVPGTTCFANSMTSGAVCSGSTSSPNTNTVAYQSPLSSNNLIFPILSLASYNGGTRAVRIFYQAVFKAGFANAIIGPQVTFSGNASPITGDAYGQTSVSFAQYQKAPLCASGATATNLTGPQIMAGTTVVIGNGPAQTPPCGSPTNAVGTFTSECAGAGATTEVAPTPCPGGRALDTTSSYALPVNWHPATPVAMNSADFTTIVTAGSLPAGVSVVTATQNGANVTYTSAGTYTPTYWSPGGSGPVKMVVATAPFCINPSSHQIQAVSPPITGSCSPSWTYYGNQVGGTAYTVRFVDWGLVTDDLSRSTAQTFFQPPSCTTCNGGSPNGLQNGIRYVPMVPTLWGGAGQSTFAQFACARNVPPPGTNVFDQVNAGDGITCALPTSLINTTNGTFSGTKSALESLVIDNAGFSQVQLNGSVAGNSTLNCTNTNFDNYNWGIIMATGDIDLQANFVFTGFIYTPGNVTSHGTVLIRGGVFSSNSGSSSGQVNQVDSLGTVNFCGGSNTVPMSPLFYTFAPVAGTWQDRPAGQP
jgi:hypothetical protein